MWEAVFFLRCPRPDRAIIVTRLRNQKAVHRPGTDRGARRLGIASSALALSPRETSATPCTPGPPAIPPPAAASLHS